MSFWTKLSIATEQFINQEKLNTGDISSNNSGDKPKVSTHLNHFRRTLNEQLKKK